MTEIQTEKLYRIAFGFKAVNHHHTRKEFNEYIAKYFPELVTTLKNFWKQKYLFVNAWGELQVTIKLLDALNNERYSLAISNPKQTEELK